MANQPTQRTLDFEEAEQLRRRRARAEERETFIDGNLDPVLDELGPKFFAEDLGIGVEKVHRIYHWKERREGQRPPAELLMAAHENNDEAFLRYCERLGWERPKKKSKLPDAVLAERALAALREFGAAGEQKITALLAKPLPREPQEWERKPEPLAKVGRDFGGVKL